ncbi:MAG: GPP34 family phosphoprotein [Desulfitobacterium sp.]|nr:GPP34 family phosphoprotein [Desulfitobacterium sp.]
MLSLTEKVLLLTINEDKGTFSFTASMVIDYILTGALLMELELLKRTTADKKTLKVLNSSSTNNPRLDEVLRQLHSSKKVHSPDYWVRKLRRSMKNLRKEILEEMVDKALLREEEHQTLIFFTTYRYPVRDIRGKKDIMDLIYRTLMRDEKPDQATTKLISLLHVSGLLPHLFDKDERKEAKKNANKISKDDILANAVKKAIQASSGSA